MKRTRCLFVFCVLVLVNIFGCSNRTSVEHAEEKSENVWEKMFDKIQKETELQANHPLVLWKEIKSRSLFHNDDHHGDLDKIIRFHLEWCLKGITDQTDLKNTNMHCEDSLRFLKERQVLYHPEVERLLKKYWDIKKRIESAKEQNIEPLEKEWFDAATKIDKLYFAAGSISINYGNLNEALQYLEKAVDAVKVAEVVGDFDRNKTWAKP